MPVKDIKPLVEANRNAVRHLSEEILTACAVSRSREEILTVLASKHVIEMDASHFLLNLSSVASHLTWLSEKGLIEHFMDGYRLLWKRV
jgi:predicted transcriptional regulator